MPDSNEYSNPVARLLKKTSIDSMKWSMDVDLDEGRCKSLAFLNAHAINNAASHNNFYEFLMCSDYLLRDGIGVKLAMKLFGLPSGENLNGTDLITKIIPRFKDRKIAIFGASIEALSAARDRLKREEGVENIIAINHGFHDMQFYIDTCKQIGPDIVILCMGMPKQELVAAEIMQQNAARLVICGGGWADFYSGTKKRAPIWIRKMSLEWVYRLCLEPKRLGKRYTVDILYYFYVILIARLGFKG